MKKQLIGAVVLSLALAACSSESSDPTGLDAAYGTDGLLKSPQSTTDHDRFISVVEGDDGRIYASGFVRVGEDTAASVTRFDSDGALDESYGTNGTATVNVAPGGKTAEVARGIVVDDDGNVVIATPFEKSPGAAGDAGKELDVALARLDADGKLDTSFGTAGISRIDLGTGKAVDAQTFVTDNVWGLAARDGGFVMFGTAANPGADRTDADFALVGVNENGARDTSFGVNGVRVVDINASGDNARNVKVADDGSILATGYSRDGDGVVSPVLIKTDDDGKLDTSFGEGGVANHVVLAGVTESYQVDFQGDDYILAGYGRGAAAEEKVDLVTYRFTADGEWDKTFGTEGVYRLDLAGDDDRARNLVVLSDDKILVAGSGKMTAENIDGLVVLLDKDGVPVEEFGDAGHVLVDLGQSADGFFGVTLADDNSVAWLAGFSGATANTPERDDSVLARIEL